jgi:hypothetical protein
VGDGCLPTWTVEWGASITKAMCMCVAVCVAVCVQSLRCALWSTGV